MCNKTIIVLTKMKKKKTVYIYKNRVAEPVFLDGAGFILQVPGSGYKNEPVFLPAPAPTVGNLKRKCKYFIF